MKYYVIYKDYTEFNQFEGSWDTEVKTFDSYHEAKEFSSTVEWLIAGPLTDAPEP